MPMQVTLTKELEKLVEQKVPSGRYADASDVMRDALRTLENCDNAGEQVAERFLATFDATMKRLAASPEMGNCDGFATPRCRG